MCIQCVYLKWKQVSQSNVYSYYQQCTLIFLFYAVWFYSVSLKSIGWIHVISHPANGLWLSLKSAVLGRKLLYARLKDEAESFWKMPCRPIGHIQLSPFAELCREKCFWLCLQVIIGVPLSNIFKKLVSSQDLLGALYSGMAKGSERLDHDTFTVEGRHSHAWAVV